MSQHRDIVVIGGSAGAIPVLKRLCGALPAALPAAVLVAIHTSPESPGTLPQVLTRAGALPAVNATDGQRVAQGRIYLAPPDHHLLLAADGTLSVTRGPRERGFRPAVDTLFRSAATSFGSRVVSVVLSGALDDGSAGVLAVKRCGGYTIVQDPTDATFSDMPLNVLRYADVDRVALADELSGALLEALRSPIDAA